MPHGGKILVVDDDDAVRADIVGILEEEGYQVSQGENGHEALSQIKEDKPDLLVMDVEMPGMSGHEVCRIIKGSKGFGFFPIILVTARDDVRTKVDGLELGADDYLVKPINGLELLARVKSMLRLKELQDELIEANQKLKSFNDRLQEMSITDPLMGICNRLYFEKRIAYEFQRAERYRAPLSLLVLDLDHFKAINDTHGHPFGDVVLKKTAQLIESNVRQVDIVARYGGEEIVVACPETEMSQARIVAERIRRAIEAAEFTQGSKKANITVSIGIAVYPQEQTGTVYELLSNADDALYQAKRRGRNCCVCASETNEQE